MTQEVRRHVDTRVIVETPEGVDFQFVIAGPGKRGAALAIDWSLKLLIIICGVIALAVGGIAIGETFAQVSVGLWLTLLFLVDWFYSSLFEAFWNGQTPGKRSLGLRVVRSNGTPITATSAVGRNFLAAADCMPRLVIAFYTVGLLAMLSNRRMQRIGDLVFDTMVIDENREWISRAAGITDGIDTIPRAECSGRFAVPERTLSVIERLFEGDRIIPDLRREEIARPLSEVLRRSMGYEEAGPDPKNPHLFFQQQPLRHTLFLRRVLKTFADLPDPAGSRRGRFSISMPSRNSGSQRRQGNSTEASPSQERAASLDLWLESENPAEETFGTPGEGLQK
jgi:uncharacterized RDD family membrane protein YckC